MATVDKIRNSLINKIISIRDKEILEAIDKLVSLSESDIVELTIEQKEMLQMSEDDIDNGQLISQDQMNKRNLEWLNEMQFGLKRQTFNLQEFYNTGQRKTNQMSIQGN